MLAFVKLLVTFSISMNIMYVMFFQRFERPRGGRFDKFPLLFLLSLSIASLLLSEVVVQRLCQSNAESSTVHGMRETIRCMSLQ